MTEESHPLDIVIVEKTGQLKLLSIKDYKESELFKKCGFKQSEGFKKQHQWTTKIDGTYYIVSVFAKTDGRANSENKYDFPPPIDTKLFFGNCAIVAIKQYVKENNDSWSSYINLTIELWTKIYEKLFGGFEDLAATALEDENEIDELKNVPKEKKTKSGYLKDGFVVDSSDTENEEYDSSCDIDDDEDETTTNTQEDNKDGEDLELEEVGSELSNEDYDYSSEEEK
jgi:hypothetical protein